MKAMPVLYLDLDDTLISWAGGKPHAAPGAHEFLAWALASFEVRWLTTWCPGGEMDEKLLIDLASMLDVDPDHLLDIQGYEWDAGGSKLNGIAWLEHVVLGRPFVWLEDDYGFKDRELSFLTKAGLMTSYRHCNVTKDPASLRHAQAWLYEWLQGAPAVAA